MSSLLDLADHIVWLAILAVCGAAVVAAYVLAILDRTIDERKS